MNIILDTNIVKGTRRMLLENINVNLIKNKYKLNLKIYLPTVVRDELINHIRKDYIQLKESIKKHAGCLLQDSLKP